MWSTSVRNAVPGGTFPLSLLYRAIEEVSTWLPRPPLVAMVPVCFSPFPLQIALSLLLLVITLQKHGGKGDSIRVTELTYHLREPLMLWGVMWGFFHDLCTYMNFAVHLSGSSAFTFTVYFLVCLIRWLC